MPAWFNVVSDLAVIALLIAGIAFFRKPKHARGGNFLAAAALLLAMGLVAYRYQISNPAIVVLMILIGGFIGTMVAFRVNMIQIPGMVAFQHGMGGVAAFSVSFLELIRNPAELSTFGSFSGLFGLVLGAATFSGSMIAAGKLSGKLKGAPLNLPGHNLILIVLATVIVLLGIATQATDNNLTLIAILVIMWGLSGVLGVVFSIRIGGADMPVLISFLNATAGLAAAFCGIIIGNRLLITCGATVAASGSILTAIMCRSMNRGLIKVFTGSIVKGTQTSGTEVKEKEEIKTESSAPQRTLDELKAEAVDVLKNAKSVIIIPGYGMALAQAQFQVAKLAKILEEMQKDVCFAIHPVAGRMPGHMNVLLAEAEVDYDKLLEMAEVNKRFGTTDAVMVIGACDVVNPAAITTEGTPISGMPILLAQDAKRVIVCNLDEIPGYSGVKNPLYKNEKTLMLLGDANSTLLELIEKITGIPQNS